uniref:AP2/ERF domain-containing protein n=1 Tax=Kalanchoe fedtschenkoi TaxID=63787 RepID=A0A7N0V2X6_KALFE
MNSNEQHRSGSNWLAFTLSNTKPLSLFHASSSAAAFGEGGAEEDAAELSMMLGGDGPKLEDFLGASSGSNSNGDGAVVFSQSANNSQQIQQQQQHHMYEEGSELRTIEAGCFARQNISGGGGIEQRDQQQPTAKKTVETFGNRTSVFRGVTRHRWTGRYEAHLWDNSCRREGQSRKGRQVYLGGYDKEDKAARAYDLAALKYWGLTTTTNFPIGNYERELEEMQNMTRQEFVASLRRRSSGFSRGASMYRGVTRHHQHGRWQARIGRVAGNKDLYLGTFSTQEEAAEAYDIAAIKFRGLNAVTNFDMSRYDVKSIANNNLPIGGMASKPKMSADSISEGRSDNDRDISESSVSFASPHQEPQPVNNSNLSFALPVKQDPVSSYWPAILGCGSNQITLATPSHNSHSHPINNYFYSNNPTATGPQYSNNMNIYCATNGSSMAGSEPGSVGTSTVIPYGTPISMTMTSSSSVVVGTHENVSSSGSGISNWVSPNLPQYQAGKPSLLVFQTPIFGVE